VASPSRLLPTSLATGARLVAVVALAAVALSGTLVGVVGVGAGLLKSYATSSELPLPPLQTVTAEASTLYADDGKTVLAVLHGPALRKPVPLSRISKTMISAVLDTEDHRFYLHGAFDIYSTLRALSVDASGAGGLQGGSTIPQQLVKQVYLTPARTLSRKIKELVIAERLVSHYSKDQILDTYLNTIYLGFSSYGVEAAAETYFGVHAWQLDLPQSALLAGLIQDPNGYDPVLYPVAARQRRAEVLGRMLHYGDISQAAYQAALVAPLPVPRPFFKSATLVTTDPVAQYYVHQVEAQLLGPGSPLGADYAQRYDNLFEGGLRIYTNFDPALQADAERAIAQGTPNTGGKFEQAMVAIDPANGRVEALVGGPGGSAQQFDVITQGARQPGSGFKLFTLLAALEQGYSVYDTLDGAGPCEIDFPGESAAAAAASPIANDAPGEGVQTLVDATANSVNCAYIRLAYEVGLGQVISMAHALGISEPVPAYPSIVIGSYAVKPLEMAAAYAAVADGGVYHQPSFINRILDRAGDVIYTGGHPGKRVVSSQVAAEATVALQAVVQYGTGTGAAIPGRQVAGKTGTTDHDVDAWFNGFTPQIEATVWMGNEASEVPMVAGADGLDVTVFGATYPAPTWRLFAQAALADKPAVDFMAPDPSLEPAPTYITSPSLVAADLTFHNAPPGCQAGYVIQPDGTCVPAAPATSLATTPTTAATTSTTSGAGPGPGAGGGGP